MDASEQAEIRRHWNRVAQLGCAITRRPEVQLAHCHGGSMREVFGGLLQHGMGRKTNDWLVIPLHHEIHLGHRGLDTHPDGPGGWEREWGKTQIELLEWVILETGTDVFARAGLAEAYQAWLSMS